MNTIGKNIRYLRKKNGLTQEDLAEETGITRAAVGSYEEGRAVPRLEGLLDIASYFGHTLDEIVRTDLSKGRDPGSDSSGIGNLRVLSTVVDPGNKELITLVPARASAGYAKGYGDPAYIEKLPAFSLPVPELAREKTYRVFQISGDSMEPVRSGSYIICEYQISPEEIKDGDPYIVITRDDGIVYKRIYRSGADEITLKSDNPAYPPFSVANAEILEIWKALGFVSFDMPAYDDAITLNRLYTMMLEWKKKNTGGV
jgi:transcriptional regulator with XRE-family HTH domain